ncbi:MAG: nuclear transport factor 2 family protein [Pseudomonadota bacterium]|uniref:DUF4440 domain-containing protein n=1 Tax=Sphingomonas sp. ERG5 TaxID=1381597 RepID=UPI00054C608B|nr:nuclear transport factor 2 family protein [Sphingomonas sp. ERG5]
MVVSLLLLLLAQTTPVQPLPKGTGLPPPGTDEAAVMAPINAAFAGISARDQAAILAQLRPNGTATVLMEKPDGTRTVRNMPIAAYAEASAGTERYEERMTDPAIEIDGAMAMVWGPYTFSIDGTVRHCGFQHFDLVQEEGRWKIQNVTWSVRTTGCAG